MHEDRKPEPLILRPYQQYAANLIMEKPAVGLFLDMGMGKTATTLYAVKELLYDYFDVQHVLVIAPLRVAETTWSDECREWEQLQDLSVVPVIGSLKQREKALRMPADIHTINRENVPWMVGYYGKDWPFDMVVLDESSSFKNHQSQRFRALKRVRPRIRRLVELTGTPAPNGLMDLWSQLFLLDGGKRLEKTITAYRRRWFYPAGGYGHVVYNYEPKPGACDEIYQAISDICVSMKAKDYISLPPVLYNSVKIALPAAARQKYKQLEKDLVLSLGNDDTIVASTAAVLSSKLLQMASGAVYDENGEVTELHRAKIEALAEIAEVNTNKPILVFYWFRHDLERLQKAFPKARQLKGAQDIRDWNDGKIPMLLVHPASAGHGLNLQKGGSLIVWFSMTWSLELYQQANKRLHRSGQTRTVVIHHLVAEGTIDEDVMKALQEKRQGQDSMLEAVKARIREYKE
ncbi:SNF2-related protein [uncultured Megasphaera sp.]|uniref:SNF2-related protein n=1 Tax=uncultured Megasphaera sp. TaxID=165188 RepID=UPI0037846F4B